MQCRCKVVMDVIVDVGVFFKEKTPIENNMILSESIFHALHILKTTPYDYVFFFPFFFFLFFQCHKIKHVFSVHSDKNKCHKASRR